MPSADRIKSGVDSQRLRDKPYLKLEGNLKRIQEVESIIERHGSDGTLAHSIESYYQEKIARTPEIEKQFAEIDSLETELRETHDELEEINELPDDAFAQAQKRYSELMSHSESLLKKINLLSSSPDITFFSSLRRGIQVLNERAKAVEMCRKDPAKYLKDRRKDIPFEEVIFSDYSVTYVVSQKTWDEDIRLSALGVHYGGTIINIVCRNSDTKQEKRTILHENKHAIFETFFVSSEAKTFGVKETEDAFRYIIAGAEGGRLSKEWVEEHLATFQRQISQEYLSGIKNELIANFDGLKEGAISTDFNTYRRLFSWLAKVEDKTKGYLKEALKNTRERLQVECQNFYIQLADTLYIAEKEGLSDDVHSAMLLLNPLDYKKIEQYLIWKIGKEKYATHQAIRRTINAPFFPIKGPPLKGKTPEEKLVEAMQRGDDPFMQAARLESEKNCLNKENVERFSLSEFAKIRFTSEEKNHFGKVIRDILDDLGDCANSLLLDNPAYVSGYLDKVTQICKTAGINADMENMRESVWSFYIYGKMEPFVKANDPESARALIQSIRPEEKKYLSNAHLAFKEILEEHGALHLISEKWQKVLQMLESN